jgi:hypothetical protein
MCEPSGLKTAFVRSGSEKSKRLGSNVSSAAGAVDGRTWRPAHAAMVVARIAAAKRLMLARLRSTPWRRDRQSVANVIWKAATRESAPSAETFRFGLPTASMTATSSA